MIISIFTIIFFYIEEKLLKIVKTKYILTPNRLLLNKAVAFNEKIVDIDDFKTLKRKFNGAKIFEYGDNSCLLPGFINSHVHLEFSANRATLLYGDFITWLNSVIEKREELISRCDEECIKNSLDIILKSGTTTIGAISSFGLDLLPCSNSSLKVIYFNEIIGSNPAAADMLFSDFLHRVEKSKEFKSKKFIPAVAIHSPYSVHRVLAKKAIDFAKDNSLLISTHFMESKAEREWLDNKRGDFKKFFEQFNQSIPANRAKDFLSQFDGYPSLFAHCVWANKEELEVLKNQNHTIIHSPVSNRLLGNGVLNFDKIKDLNVAVATDGLSSNYSLNLYDELKAALFIHSYIELKRLAFDLIKSVTINAAKALRLNSGEIKIDMAADLQIVKLPNDLENLESIALHIILNNKMPKNIFIEGELHG